MTTGDEPAEPFEVVALPEAWATVGSANDGREPARGARGTRAMLEVQYDAATRVLRIEWASGNIYELDDIPPSVHEGLCAAESKGKYFQEWIRDRYRHRRIL